MDSYGRVEFLQALAEGCVLPTAQQGLEQVWQLLLLCLLCRVICRLGESIVHNPGPQTPVRLLVLPQRMGAWPGWFLYG